MQYSKIIKDREELEKEKEKKGIFLSCIEINKEDLENGEKRQNNEIENEIEEDIDLKNGKNEEDLDEWEEIGNDDNKSIQDDEDFEVEEMIKNGYEIQEDYVDRETAKNESK